MKTIAEIRADKVLNQLVRLHDGTVISWRDYADSDDIVGVSTFKKELTRRAFNRMTYEEQKRSERNRRTLYELRRRDGLLTECPQDCLRICFREVQP
jgi:hypothetical protein